MNSHIKKTISALALAGFSVTGAFAQQTLNGLVNVWIDGESFGLTMVNSEDKPLEWNLFNQTIVTTENGSVEFTELTISQNPFITFSAVVTDTGTASTFDFTFSDPIILADGPTDVRSFISGGLTDGGSDGVTLSEFSSGTPFLAADVDGTNLGVDLSGLPVGVPAGVPGTSFSFSEGFKSGPSLTSPTTLTAKVKFGLSGGDDIISLTGRVDVDAVPEPSTYTLIAALGAASFVFFFRKRK